MEEIGRLEAVLDREPRSHRFARLADLYRESGDLRRGLDVVDAGLRHHPHYLNACLVRARILDDLGERRAAREAFERVLEIDDENQVARSAVERLATAPERSAPSKGWAERASGTADWLANLEAAWRGESAPAVSAASSPPARPASPPPPDSPAETGSSPQAGRSSPVRPPAPGPEPDTGTVAGDSATPDAREAPPAKPRSGSMETATMAALYLEQGLYDEAISMYERLLARDPYNVSLAAGLDRARQRGAAQPQDPSPVPPPPSPVRRSTPTGSDRGKPTARDYLTAVLDGAAPTIPVEVTPAVERLRRALADRYARSD